MRGTRILLGATLLLVAACSGGSDGQAAPAPRAAVWADAGPVVEVGPPAVLLVPGPDWPEGAVVTALRRPAPDPTDVVGDGRTGAAQTLFADPAAADPLAGPMVLVGRAGAEETSLGLAPVHPPSGEPVDLGHGRWYVEWLLPQAVPEHEPEVGFVLTSGLPREAAARAAREASVASRPAVAPAGRPGLDDLGTLGITGMFLGRATPPTAEVLEVAAGDARLTLSVYRGDPRLRSHLALWGADAEGPALRRGLVHVATRHGATVLVEVAPEAPAPAPALVDEVVAALVPGDEEAVAAAQEAAVAAGPPPEAECAGLPAPDRRLATLSGRTGTGRWEAVLGVGDWGDDQLFWTTCGALESPDGAARAVDAGRRLDPAGPDVVVAEVSFVSPARGQEYLMVTGHVGVDGAAVEVTYEGLPPVRAERADVGPTDGRRWFGAALDITAVEITFGADLVVAVRATDADGRTVAETLAAA